MEEIVADHHSDFAKRRRECAEVFSLSKEFAFFEHAVCGQIDFSVDVVPLKLLEMGCLPGECVELIQKAPLKDPLYIRVNGSHLAIRIETASQIIITKE